MLQKNYYHFLSSAARRQYAEDIIRALALPRGAHLQFRYLKELLTKNVQDDITGSEIIGSECFLSFLHIREKNIPSRIIPCRKGKVVRAGFFGPFAVVVFAVNDFVFSNDVGSFTDQLQKDCSDQLPQWRQIGDDFKLAGHWALSAQVAPKDIQQRYDITLFAEVANILAELYPFNDETEGKLNPFFHVSIFSKPIETSANFFSEADLEQSMQLSSGKLSLNSGSDYNIRVHHYYPPYSKYNIPYSKKLIIDLDGLAPQYDGKIELRIASEYDVVDVPIKTLSSPFSLYRRISIYLKHNIDNNGELIFADINLPVSTKPAILRGIISVVSISFGVALPAIIGASFRPEFSGWSVLAMVGGGLLAGIAAVYGLRRSV